MKIRLAYGKTGREVTLPDSADVTVVEPRFVPALPDAAATIRDALAAPIGTPPLRQLVKSTDTVAIVFSDITRPAPNSLLIPLLLEELGRAGVPRERVTLFNATGTHRANTPEELAGMLGPAAGCRIIQNDARAVDGHAVVGTTSSGNTVRLQKDFLACSFKILTGFIEPHFFAGFSGGGKAMLPGLARMDSIIANHGARNIDDPQAQWAVLDGNPIRREIEETVGFVEPDFLLNVTLNRDKGVTAVFTGDVTAAHRAGAKFVKETAMVRVPAAFDIVLTSNSGYPLDLNLYQAVKGMSAAARITRPGGAIVIAAECWDGIPDTGSFGTLMKTAASLDDLLGRIRAPGFLQEDQWEAHLLALIAKNAEVYVHAGGLTEEQIRAVKLRPCPSIEECVGALLSRRGPGARICALPEGPQTMPYID